MLRLKEQEPNISNVACNNDDLKQISDKSFIKYISYDESNFEESDLENIDNLKDKISPNQINWINIISPRNLDLKNLETHFNIHPLIIEDIYSTNQRLKIDPFPDYLFIVLNAINSCEDEELELEQVSIILSKNYVFSFQEFSPDQFVQIQERIKQSRGRIRKQGVDYLVYVLFDVLVDNYFTILEDFGDKLEELQENLVRNPNPEILQEIYDFKKKILKIRKATWPLREVISQLSKRDSEFISDSSIIYFRDVNDHIFHIIDTIETYREMTSGLIDLFMSSISNKMNEIMKVLTIIATIFIPLTFIVGIYGMNFQFMPELAWKWGYLTIICIMVLIALGMIVFFRRKKWL